MRLHSIQKLIDFEAGFDDDFGDAQFAEAQEVGAIHAAGDGDDTEIFEAVLLGNDSRSWMPFILGMMTSSRSRSMGDRAGFRWLPGRWSGKDVIALIGKKPGQGLAAMAESSTSRIRRISNTNFPICAGCGQIRQIAMGCCRLPVAWFWGFAVKSSQDCGVESNWSC